MQMEAGALMNWRSSSVGGRRQFEPILPGSPIHHVLVVVIAMVNMVTPVVPMKGVRRRWRQALGESREMVDEMWGPHLVVSKRLQNRLYLHNVLLIEFGMVALPSIGLFVIGDSAGAPAVRVAGGIGLGLGGLLVGLQGPVVVRGYFLATDFFKWKAAGMPDQWDLSPRSQLRSADLVPAAALGGLVAALFVQIALG